MTKDEAHNKRAIAAIHEQLIGFNGNLENKTFLHEGALIELDPESYRPICRVYFFLLNDLLIVGKVKHDKWVFIRTEFHPFLTGLIRPFLLNNCCVLFFWRKLEYAMEYDATKIAVINIKDLDGVKNAINVITPEEVKVFQCISATTKVRHQNILLW